MQAQRDRTPLSGFDGVRGRLPLPKSPENHPMSKVALFVELKAKPGKQEELAALLASAQPLAVAEPSTWRGSPYG